jgi:hypothetical protein
VVSRFLFLSFALCLKQVGAGSRRSCLPLALRRARSGTAHTPVLGEVLEEREVRQHRRGSTASGRSGRPQRLPGYRRLLLKSNASSVQNFIKLYQTRQTTLRLKDKGAVVTGAAGAKIRGIRLWISATILIGVRSDPRKSCITYDWTQFVSPAPAW